MFNQETVIINCLDILLWIQQDKILGVIVSICALYFCNKAVKSSYIKRCVYPRVTFCCCLLIRIQPDSCGGHKLKGLTDFEGH